MTTSFMKSILTACSCGILALGVNGGALGQRTAPVIEYSRDPQAVVISFDVRGDFRDDVPIVRVYGDGRIHVHRDRGQDFQMWLSHNEMEEWLRFLYDKGILTFDVKRIRDSIDTARRERLVDSRTNNSAPESIVRVAGGSIVVIEVFLTAFRPAETSAELVPNFSTRIAWDQPRATSEEFPEVPELADLADVVDAFDRVRTAPELEQIRDE